MGSSIVSWLLQIILQAIGIFVQDQKRKIELEAKIKGEIERYKQGVKDSSKVRDEHQKLDQKLDAEWEKKFGKPPAPEVSEVSVNESFIFQAASGVPEGKAIEVWAEKQYFMGTMGWNSLSKRYQLTLAFNQPGVRVISLKIDGEWLPTSTTVTVRPV